MEIQIRCSFEQYFKANEYVQVHTSAKKRWNYYTVMFVFPVLGFILLLLTVVDWRRQHKLSAVLLNVVLAFFMLWSRFSWRSRMLKLYKQQTDRLEGVMTLDSQGFCYVRADGNAQGQFKWEAFAGWGEMSDSFLLFCRPSGFQRIPKNDLNAEAQNELRGWLHSLPRAK